jgi:hypothetical protein
MGFVQSWPAVSLMLFTLNGAIVASAAVGTATAARRNRVAALRRKVILSPTSPT